MPGLSNALLLIPGIYFLLSLWQYRTFTVLLHDLYFIKPSYKLKIQLKFKHLPSLLQSNMNISLQWNSLLIILDQFSVCNWNVGNWNKVGFIYGWLVFNKWDTLQFQVCSDSFHQRWFRPSWFQIENEFCNLMGAKFVRTKLNVVKRDVLASSLFTVHCSPVSPW